MGNIAFVEDDGLDATKGYADACWRRDPEISPSSWRVSQGFTVGKVAFDGRAGWQGLEVAVGVGCNLLLGTAETVAALSALPVAREALVVVQEVGEVGSLVAECEVALWRVPGARCEVRGEVLAALEEKVKAGDIGCYGIAVERVLDLGAWLTAADEAAAVVWGRRKRSALRALMLPLNLAEQGMVREPLSFHRDEAVSVLELAARRDLLVLAERSTRWRGPWGEVEIEGDGEVAVRARQLLEGRVSEAWQGLETRVQAWGVVSSVPGVTAVVAELSDAGAAGALRVAMVRGDMPDVAGVLG